MISVLIPVIKQTVWENLLQYVLNTMNSNNAIYLIIYTWIVIILITKRMA